MRTRSTLLTALFALSIACSSTAEPIYSTGSVFVANATNGFIDVDVDGRRRTNGLSMNATSFALSVPIGLHTVRLSRGVLGGAIEIPVDVGAENSQTVVAFPAYPVGTSDPFSLATTLDIAAKVLPDTGTWVPGGKSKLRVVHLAVTAGDIQIWRRQPDFPAGSPIMTPFPYGAASPYLESDAGVWEVWLTAPGGGTKLLSTGPIQIPSGERRTIVLVDTQEGPRFVVMGL
jgi:hypothetical protein